MLLRDEPVFRHLRGRIRQQRHLGVAVHVHFFEIVVVFQIVDGLFLFGELLVPAGLADRLAHLDEVHQAGVVAQEMGVPVDDVLARQPGGALVGEIGGRRLGDAGVEEMSEHLVHRDERCGHARGRLKEAPARQAMPFRQLVAHLLQPRLDLALLLGLRHRQVLLARHDLRRHRRGKRGGLGRQQVCQIFICQELHWALPQGHLVG